MKFKRKELVTIEAIQVVEVLSLVYGNWKLLPKFVMDAYTDGQLALVRDGIIGLMPKQGAYHAVPTDWMLCVPLAGRERIGFLDDATFRAMYDPVEEAKP